MSNIKRAVVVVLISLPIALFAGDGKPDLRLDPHTIMGPEECGECHKSEIAAWRETHHAKSFFELTRRQEARDIAANMGIKRIKRDSDCMNCHFTSKPDGDVIKPFAGTSCESCHGAAKDWMDIHNDYGGKDVKKEDESPAHREKRIADSLKHGMIRPDDLYAVAANCFQCHTVPNEKLVNVGGHTAGSKFELVSWSQGEIRHNYFRSPDGNTNVENTQEKKREMYVIGRALDLEYSMRAVAKATAKDTFAVENAKRVKRALARLKQIQEKAAIAEVAAMIDAGSSVKLKLNNETNISAAADKVAQSAKALAKSINGGDLAAIDDLLPEPDNYKGSVFK